MEQLCPSEAASRLPSSRQFLTTSSVSTSTFLFSRDEFNGQATTTKSTISMNSGKHTWRTLNEPLTSSNLPNKDRGIKHWLPSLPKKCMLSGMSVLDISERKIW